VLWHTPESADSLVELCRSLLFNFAFPSAHSTTLVLPYERAGPFPAKLESALVAWARVLIPAIITSPTSTDAIQSRLLALLLNTIITPPERTRPLGYACLNTQSAAVHCVA
jgi:hypothetical protein